MRIEQCPDCGYFYEYPADCCGVTTIEVESVVKELNLLRELASSLDSIRKGVQTIRTVADRG